MSSSRRRKTYSGNSAIPFRGGASVRQLTGGVTGIWWVRGDREQHFVTTAEGSEEIRAESPEKHRGGWRELGREGAVQNPPTTA